MIFSGTLPSHKRLCVVCIAVVCLLMPACGGWHRGPKPVLTTRAVPMMSTIVEIKVAHLSDQDGNRLIDAALEEMKRVADLTSSYDPHSALSRVNDLIATGEAATDPELFSLISRARQLAEQTGGAFDFTLWKLTRLWNIENEPSVPPPDEDIRRLLAHTGYAKVGFDAERSVLRFDDTGMALDLGGIAKGYAVDRGIEKLKVPGVLGALVNAGGDLAAFGVKPDGRPWRIGIQHPRRPNEYFCVVPIQDAAMATSGDYERYFMSGGIRYHHLLDPKSGYPSRGMVSATVLAGDCTTADALATAAFVRGADILSLYPNDQDVERVEQSATPGGSPLFLLVREDGELVLSPGLDSQCQLRPEFLTSGKDDSRKVLKLQ